MFLVFNLTGILACLKEKPRLTEGLPFGCALRKWPSIQQRLGNMVSAESEGGDRAAQSPKGMLALGPAGIRLALGP